MGKLVAGLTLPATQRCVVFSHHSSRTEVSTGRDNVHVVEVVVRGCRRLGLGLVAR